MVYHLPESKTMSIKGTVKRAPLFHPYSRRFHLVLLLACGFCCTTFMRMHFAITMTCMVNSTAVSLMEEEMFYPEHFNKTLMDNLIEQSHEADSERQCERRAEDGHTIVVDYGGFVIPSINAIIANWFPIDEKSTVLALYTAGNQFAGAVGNPLAAGFCASSFGWPAVFYFIACIGIIWCLLWIFSSSDQPRKCSRMSDKERAYLTSKVVHRPNRANKASSVPYARMLLSAPFLAQMFCIWV
ncbi:hypothetical protein Y032_0566g24 [Ancylostoma ceylanicum]|nr:hypothetical protein Y032_0566g24 [Ancylostoma ceylanicum]